MKNIVILTGSGISAESGLKTFRSEDGLWLNHRVEDVCTVEAFERKPAVVHSFYNECRVIDIDNPELSGCRLALVKASQIVIKNALTLLGVSAPIHM